jgi:hypothetical protein
MDLAGNLGEWTGSSVEKQFEQPPTYAYVGSWGADAGLTTLRDDSRSHLIGFRCAKSLPSVDVQGAIGKDGVLVGAAFIEPGDPWGHTDGAGDYTYGCAHDEGGVLSVRVRRRGPATRLKTYTWDGVSFPPDASPAGEVDVAQDAIVAPKAQATLVSPDRTYYVSESVACGTGFLLASRPSAKVQLRKGDIVACVQTENAFACSTAEASWWADHDAWLEEHADDDLASSRDRGCFARSLSPVKFRQPTSSALGWWIQLEEGWLLADGHFIVEVQCRGECEGIIAKCVNELGCLPEDCSAECTDESNDGTPFIDEGCLEAIGCKRNHRCESKCAELHRDCAPSWKSVQ